MDTRPDIIVQGEKARMFPVLADSSREGRVLSIFFSCFGNVTSYGRELLSDMDLKVNSRTTMQTWTEVVPRKQGAKVLRPDGLIVLEGNGKRWTAFVEAKVGSSPLDAEQVEAYLELAKANGVDALITISNQFAPLPGHHPVTISQNAAKKAKLYHWSWSDLLTRAILMTERREVGERDQAALLAEFVRFMSHAGSGVQSFEQMPPEWSEVASRIQSRTPISPRSPEVQDTVAAWHQETQDLCCILSRKRLDKVTVRVPKAHSLDPYERMRADSTALCEQHHLTTVIQVPGAASHVHVTADFAKRAIYFSMTVQAPLDRKSTKARVNWLLRHLEKAKSDSTHVRVFWPGKTQYTQHSLEALRNSPDIAEQVGKVATGFEVMYLRDLGTRFAQRKSFIVEMETHFPVFYDNVGQFLRAWQPPKVKAVVTAAEQDPSGVSEVLAEAGFVQTIDAFAGDNPDPLDDTTSFEAVGSEGEDETISFDFHCETHGDDHRSVLEAIRRSIARGGLHPVSSHGHAARLKSLRLFPLLRRQAALLATGAEDPLQ